MMLDQLDLAMTGALRDQRWDEYERLAAVADRQQAAREARLSAPGALGDAARYYAGHGIAVFPLARRSKAPLIPNPHPKDSPERYTCRGECGQLGHGCHDATTDPATVARWWNDHPDANVGLATGHLFDVIDIDGPPGYQSLADLREESALPAVLGRATTPRGGMHLYTGPTGGGNATKFRPGLDYRGRGGYVVAPPSIVDGRRYDWIEPFTPGVAA